MSEMKIKFKETHKILININMVTEYIILNNTNDCVDYLRYGTLRVV